MYDPSVANPHGVLEIKYPALAQSTSIKDVCTSKPSFFLKAINGGYKLKPNHNYFYQVQGQMHIINRKWCDFVVWTPADSSDLLIQRIEYDHKFWNEKMYPQLR